MFTDSNILLFLLAVLPGLFYAWIIYISSPRNILKPRLIFSYLLYGMISVILVHIIHFIFPHWMEYMFTNTTFTICDGEFLTKEIPSHLSILFKNYIQVGLTEEFSKVVIFLSILFLRIKSFRVKDSAYSIMYYMMMVSLGFALVENIDYGLRAYRIFTNGGDVPPSAILLVRSVTAIIAHMIFGLVMGFFVALGVKEQDKVKKIMLFLTGLITAATMHGSYNYSLRFNWFLTISLLVIGLLGTFFMSRKLIRKH